MEIDFAVLIPLIIIAALVIWCTILTLAYLKLHKFLKLFTTGISKQDLKTLLESIQSRLDKHQQAVEKVEESLNHQQKKARQAFQKHALVRYNPFGDAGGNQSFVLSLLNADDEGVVVTSLHARDLTRVYAKEVSPGSPKPSLSKEEQEAISKAMKGRP